MKNFSERINEIKISGSRYYFRVCSGAPISSHLTLKIENTCIILNKPKAFILENDIELDAKQLFGVDQSSDYFPKDHNENNPNFVVSEQMVSFERPKAGRLTDYMCVYNSDFIEIRKTDIEKVNAIQAA